MKVNKSQLQQITVDSVADKHVAKSRVANEVDEMSRG